VPTWNYVAVHAYGRPQVIEDTQGALDVLTKLSTAYEGADPSSWNLDRLPPGNAEAQTRGIVAFRMPIVRTQTKIKLSQNRDLEDRTRVIAKLEESDNQDAQSTAQWMKRVLPQG
jgi:transcriptional regulator